MTRSAHPSFGDGQSNDTNVLHRGASQGDGDGGYPVGIAQTLTGLPNRAQKIAAPLPAL